MPPEKGDAAYLWDMLEAARTVQEITRDIDFTAYRASRTVQLATERAIEIVGEAARFVSAPFRTAHPEIPWTKIVGQRHVLAHHYGAIQHDRLWRVVVEDIPALIARLAPLVPPAPTGPSDQELPPASAPPGP
jgi:uncharacterized protein with HEPN domain